MTFINEIISKEDREKYRIDEINMRWNGAGSPQRFWTVNKKQDIWIREFNRTQDRDNNGCWDKKTTWDYYWKGLLLSVDTLLIDGEITEQEAFFHYKLLSINIPDTHKSDMSSILKDFRKALSVYRLTGVYSDINKKLKVRLDY